MTITAAVLTKGGSNVDASTYVTAAFQPTRNRLVVAAINTAAKATPTAGVVVSPIPSGHGPLGNWKDIGSGQGFGAHPGWMKCFLLDTYGWDPPSSTLTFSQVTDGVGDGLAGGAIWMVAEFANDGVERLEMIQRHPFGGDNVNRTTADALTLPALNAFADAANIALGVWCGQDTAGGAIDFTAGTGFTKLDNIDQAIDADTYNMMFEYKANDTTIDATILAASDRIWGQGMEIGVAHRKSLVPSHPRTRRALMRRAA